MIVSIWKVVNENSMSIITVSIMRVSKMTLIMTVTVLKIFN